MDINFSNEICLDRKFKAKISYIYLQAKSRIW